MKTKEAVTALAALAQESRLAIYRQLVQAGPQGMAAGAIAEKLGLPPATLSFHLKELSHAGLAVSRQEGRYVIYSANFGNALKLVNFLTENCCGGQSCQPGCAPVAVVNQGA
ncbi:MAG: ArsR/SmtB family transcription factor [Burkholderiales bacterium]